MKTAAEQLAELEAEQRATAAKIKALRRKQRNADRRADRAARAETVQLLGEIMLALYGGDWRAVDWADVLNGARGLAEEPAPETAKRDREQARAALDAAKAEWAAIKASL
jgi:hypothetical protein